MVKVVVEVVVHVVVTAAAALLVANEDVADWVMALNMAGTGRASFSYKQCTLARAFRLATRCVLGPLQKPNTFMRAARSSSDDELW